MGFDILFGYGPHPAATSDRAVRAIQSSHSGVQPAGRGSCITRRLESKFGLGFRADQGREFGLEQDGYRPYREILAMGLRLLFEESGIKLSQRQSLALVLALPRWKPFPETRRVLRSLHAAGYRLAVLSNTDDALLRKSLKRIGIPIDFSITSQQVRSFS